MVLIHVTKGTEEFIYETTTTAKVDQVTRELSELHNTRLRVKRLAGAVRELIKYGPMRPEEKRGLTEEEINASGPTLKSDPNNDPLGMRQGANTAPSEQLGATLERTVSEAEQYISNNQATRRIALKLSQINELIGNVRGAVMMAYPMGLPTYDVIRQILENREDLTGQEASKHVLDPDTAQLWFAGKELDRDELMIKYIGKNEKVTIKAKLQPRGGGAPQREAPIDEDTRRKMMAHWHKKEQQEKELASADEDSYLNSEWANPRGYKNAMIGIGDIKYRPGQR